MTDSNADANMVIEVFVLDRPLPEAEEGPLQVASAEESGSSRGRENGSSPI